MVLKRDNRSLSNLNYIDVYLLMYELVGVLKTIIWSSSFSIKQLPHQGESYTYLCTDTPYWRNWMQPTHHATWLSK